MNGNSGPIVRNISLHCHGLTYTTLVFKLLCQGSNDGEVLVLRVQIVRKRLGERTHLLLRHDVILIGGCRGGRATISIINIWWQ